MNKSAEIKELPSLNLSEAVVLGKSHLTSLRGFPLVYNEDKTMQVALRGTVWIG